MLYFEEDLNWQVTAEAKKLMQKAYEKLRQEKESKSVGYYTLGKDSLPLVQEVKEYQKNSEYLQNIECVVVVGIGGSSLGTKALHSIFKEKCPNCKDMLFLENPDEIDLSKKFARIKKEKTVFVIVSKSGNTVETISIFKKIIEVFNLDYKKDDKEKLIIVTDNDSNLHKFANYYNIKSYTIPSNVGGRFSVLSAVGVVPLTLAGFEISSVLQGASEMIDSFFAGEKENILKKAAFYVLHKKLYPMNVLFSYANCLEDFTKWYVQLWGESLGKIDTKGEHVGLTPIGHIGSVDQHSFLQLIIEGCRDKTVTFIKLENFEKRLKIPNIKLKFLEKTDFINGYTFNELIDGECEATKESIIQQNIPVDMITISKIDGENIGKLIAYYELLTSACGNMMDINPYNQPGVELGKRILVTKFSKGRKS